MKLGIMSNSGVGNSNSEVALENFQDLWGNGDKMAPKTNIVRFLMTLGAMGNFGVGISNSEVVFENFQDLGGNGEKCPPKQKLSDFDETGRHE